MDLALNNLQSFICHKTQTTANQKNLSPRSKKKHRYHDGPLLQHESNGNAACLVLIKSDRYTYVFTNHSNE